MHMPITLQCDRNDACCDGVCQSEFSICHMPIRTLCPSRRLHVKTLTPNLEKTLPILLPILIARIPQGKSSVSFEIRGTNFNSFQIKLVTKSVTNLKNSDGRTGNLDVQRQNNNYLFRDKMKIIANTNNM